MTDILWPDWSQRGARVVATDIVLFRSTGANACLTHRLRWLVKFDRYDNKRIIGLCGFIAMEHRFDFGPNTYTKPGYESIDPNDETFICHLCQAIAQRRGIDTFNLIPDTGCSATGGTMYRPRTSTFS